MTMRDQPSRAEQFRQEHSGSDVELGYAGFNTFLKASPRDIADVSDADAAVVGAPYDNAVSNRPGARYGPKSLREASSWWAYLSEYKGGLTNIQTNEQVDFSDLQVADCGDVPVFPMDRERTAESIWAHIATIAEQTFPVLLGGDHYCTYPAVEGFAEGAGHNDVGLVQIDAHTDTVSESPVFGEHFHGSSTHLISESPYVDYENISQIGIRGYESPEFFEFADETGLNLFTMRDLQDGSLTDIVETAMAAAADGTDAVYVTFDIDAVDPGTAPGTGTPVPGGLTSHQAIRIMETIAASPELGAVDLMEVAPTFDDTEQTQNLAAYLLVTVLERQFAR